MATVGTNTLSFQYAGHTVTLSAIFGMRPDNGTTLVTACSMKPGKYATQAFFVAELRKALAASNETLTITESGTDISISAAGKLVSLEAPTLETMFQLVGKLASLGI